MGWFTKTVEVEKVVEKVVERVVFGEPTAVTLYEARVEDEHYSIGVRYSTLKAVKGHYLSCADAFKEWPSAKVIERKAFHIGGEYFLMPAGAEPVTVTKPKRDKGKARAV